MLGLQQISSAVVTGKVSLISDSSSRSPKARPFRSASSIRAAASATMDSAVRTAMKPKSFYEVLGVPQQSDIKEIKSAFRHLARATHPDVAAVENKEESTKEFLRIHAAYTTLSDPETRARYDLQLSLQSLPRFSPRSSGFSGYGYDLASGSPTAASPGARASPQWKVSKSWETDQCW